MDKNIIQLIGNYGSTINGIELITKILDYYHYVDPCKQWGNLYNKQITNMQIYGFFTKDFKGSESYDLNKYSNLVRGYNTKIWTWWECIESEGTIINNELYDTESYKYRIKYINNALEWYKNESDILYQTLEKEHKYKD